MQQRHEPALQALELSYKVVANPGVLAQLNYSAEQSATAVSLFGNFIGLDGPLHVPLDDWDLRREVDMRPHQRGEAPFTVQLLFLLISRHLPIMALAECISRALFGFWSQDRRTFFPDPLPAGVFGVRWGIHTVSAREIGHAVVSFTGAFIDAVRFAEAWPKARFRAGLHFMGKEFCLPLAEGSLTIFQTEASDGLHWAKPHWYRYFGDSMAGELHAILDGNFCVAKQDLPLKPIFQKNHSSYETEPAAKAVLTQMVAGWFDSNVLEYACRWHRLPQCILACGAVGKNSAPWWRLVTDARKINDYCFAWRVKYVTIADLCLMLMPCALLTVRDLKAAYHLIKYGGCCGAAQFLVRWVTNHSRAGYVAKKYMQAGCCPSNCTGYCDKSLLAICVEGHVGRFSAAQFGHKVSNPGLSIVTDAVVTYSSKELEINSGSYVDDFLRAILVALHAICAGLAGGCPVCVAAAGAAQPRFDALDQMFINCDLVFSTKGTCVWRRGIRSWTSSSIRTWAGCS